jgi:fumarate reductase flavoprotein subunit
MELSRRSFLKGSVLAAAGIGAVGLAACSAQAPAATPQGSQAAATPGNELFGTGIETELSLDDATYDVDIVIVGAGAAGMAACATAAEEGLNALLVEANSSVGGTTQFAEGIAGVNTPEQQAAGINLNIQELVNGELAYSNYCADARLISDYLEEADANIEWFKSMGVEFYPQIGGQTQHLYVGQGKAMIEKVNEYALGKGAQILTSTKAKRLFMYNGKVTGLLCEDENGQDLIIKAGAVILACGGYINNDEMVDELQRFRHERVRITAAPGHDGAQMNMAYSAGADQSGITLMHFIWAALDSFDLHSELSTAACNEGYFWIDSHGERFCDESLTTNPPGIDNIILNQKRAYSILTDAEAQRLATEGCSIGWGSYIFAGAQMTNLPTELEQAKQDSPEGFFYGESIEELAAGLEVEADVLRNTISTYNQMVAAGEDTDFGKKAPFLHAVTEDGPYYAFELKCSAFCTMGGIRINRKNEILDEDFNGIPGLYCAGVDCSGLQGTTYCIVIGGGAQAHAVYSGRNSVRQAAAYLNL